MRNRNFYRRLSSLPAIFVFLAGFVFAQQSQQPERPWMNAALSPEQRADLALKQMTQHWVISVEDSFSPVQESIGFHTTAHPVVKVSAKNSNMDQVASRSGCRRIAGNWGARLSTKVHATSAQSG